MDESSHRVGADESERPEDKKYDGDCVEHGGWGCVFFVLVRNQILQSISRGARRGGCVRRGPGLLAHSRSVGSTAPLGATVGEARSERQG